MNNFPATPEGDKTPTPRILFVDHIEAGTFIAGDEDAHNFGARDEVQFVVIRHDDLISLERRISALEGDKRRLDWLETTYAQSKWDDFLPGIRPRHTSEFYATAKYVGEDGWTVRKAIDAAELACPATSNPPPQ